MSEPRIHIARHKDTLWCSCGAWASSPEFCLQVDDPNVDREKATCLKCRSNYGLTKSTEVLTIPRGHIPMLKSYPAHSIGFAAAATLHGNDISDFERPNDPNWRPITNEQARCQWCGQLPPGKNRYPDPFVIVLHRVRDLAKWELAARKLCRGRHLTIVKRGHLVGAVRSRRHQLAKWVEFVPAPRKAKRVPNRYERLRDDPVLEECP